MWPRVQEIRHKPPSLYSIDRILHAFASSATSFRLSPCSRNVRSAMPDRLGRLRHSEFIGVPLRKFYTSCPQSQQRPTSRVRPIRREDSLRSFRVPAEYLGSAFVQFFFTSLFRRINNLTYVMSIDPGSHFVWIVEKVPC
jgi:hypothetical protein